MQAPAAKSAAPGFQSFVSFLVSLGVKEHAAIAVANKNDDHPRLLMLFYSFVKGATRKELCDLIGSYLSLPQALDGEELEKTMEILEDYVLVTQASISSGKKNPSVQQFRLTMLEHANKYCSPPQTAFLDDLVLQRSVTIYDLLDTNGTPAGVMEVFPEVLRDHIIGAIPKAPALLEHLLAVAEAARARKRVREVLEEPDELFCDENISDLDRKCCSTDSTHDTTVSAEQASAEEASGCTTPPPTKMSKLELFRLQCAPLKMPRQRQD
jgi:hypothetical protein